MTRTNVAARRTGTVIAFSLMLLGALTMVLPFLWMVTTSLKESRLVFTFPPEWIPDPIDWANYLEVWDVAPLAVGLLNSVIVTVLVVTVGTFSSTMAAFAFAKLDFPHKDRIFVALLATIMIPMVVLIIPHISPSASPLRTIIAPIRVVRRRISSFAICSVMPRRDMRSRYVVQYSR